MKKNTHTTLPLTYDVDIQQILRVCQSTGTLFIKFHEVTSRLVTTDQRPRRWGKSLGQWYSKPRL